MVQTGPHTPADRETLQHEAESDGFTHEKVMSGVKSKTLWIRQRTGLSDSTILLFGYRQETSDFPQLAIAT